MGAVNGVAAGPAVDMGQTHLGGCLCGAIRYRVTGKLRAAVACHCRQCRKTSGHFVTATAVGSDRLEIDDTQKALTWYRSSDVARRGFCDRCGSSLFWQSDGEDVVSIMAGTLEGATGLHTAMHIFVADRGDYYELDDSIPHYAQDASG